MNENDSAVLALAGRLIDPADAVEERFPLASEDRVRNDMAEVFREYRIQLIVSSAACGADLLALDVAREMSVPSLVVLPQPKARFRLESVSGRPGSWTPIFDLIIEDATQRGCLLTIRPPASESPYRAATREIIRQARRAAASRRAPLVAIAVWEGKERGKDDHTAAFLRSASDAGAMILPYIDTLHTRIR